MNKKYILALTVLFQTIFSWGDNWRGGCLKFQICLENLERAALMLEERLSKSSAETKQLLPQQPRMTTQNPQINSDHDFEIVEKS